MRDGDHLTYEHGYVSWAQEIAKNILSTQYIHVISREIPTHFLGVRLSDAEQRIMLTGSENERTKLILQKLQERF